MSERGSLFRDILSVVQTVAVIGTIGISAYAFLFLDPSRVPTAEATVSEVTDSAITDENGRRLVPVQVAVTFSNPSTRVVHVAGNYWRATGIRYGARPRDLDWVANANENMKHRAPSLAGANYTATGADMLGAGPILGDTRLAPGETVTNTLIFYVPEGAYQAVDIEGVLPFSPSDDFELEWELTADGTMTPHVYRKGENGAERTELAGEELGRLYERRQLFSASWRRHVALRTPEPRAAVARVPAVAPARAAQ